MTQNMRFGCVDLTGLGQDLLRWRDDGYFCAERGDGRVVRGVASDAEAVAELLRRADVLTATGPVHQARPAHEVVDFGWSSEAVADASDPVQADLATLLHSGRPGDLIERLCAVASRIPVDAHARKDRARSAAADLNVSAPQVDSHRLFTPPFNQSDVGALGVTDRAMRGSAMWAQWVAPQLLTSTNARTWGDIDRRPPRDTVVQVAEWLTDAVAEDALDRWLQEMFLRDPILLNRIEGPAGPVYEVVVGTHRAHATRIWGLPWVLARVRIDRLPGPLRPRSVDLEALWDGLSSRGLLKAHREGELWYVREAPAEWMLAPPATAVQWNAMYDRVYPGVLQSLTGLTTAELFEAHHWAAALRP